MTIFETLTMRNADLQDNNTRPAESSGGDCPSVQTAFHRRKAFGAVIVLMLYIASYSLLSAKGEYCWRPSGEYRYQGGMAMFDLSLWRPAELCWERRKSAAGDYIIEADLLGWFYLPLIAADRRWVHPTSSVFDIPAA
jgi:hypothetical protein